MTQVSLTLEEIRDLARNVLLANGCDDENADALADIITRAERDGSHSHGLFRVPGYVMALRSGKVDGRARPTVEHLSPAVIRVDGHGCFRAAGPSHGVAAAGRGNEFDRDRRVIAGPCSSFCGSLARDRIPCRTRAGGHCLYVLHVSCRTGGVDKAFFWNQSNLVCLASPGKLSGRL